METTLFDKDGNAVAYIAEDYNETIYLWEGAPVAYVYEDRHIYGMNGRHLGWFINDIIFNALGERIGYTTRTCPISIAKESIKPHKGAMEQVRPRWAAPPLANLSFMVANQELADFLKEGQNIRIEEKPESEESDAPQD